MRLAKGGAGRACVLKRHDTLTKGEVNVSPCNEASEGWQRVLDDHRFT